MKDQSPNNSRTKRRVGVLVPFTNTNLEPDLQMLCPPGMSFHFTRIGGYAEETIPDADEMAKMGDAGIEEALDLISGCKPDAILYGCTSATLAHGQKFDTALAKKIKSATGALTITAAGAIVTELRERNIDKVSLATPYVGEINRRTIGFLADEGVETVGIAEIGQELSSHEQGALIPTQICDLALKANRDEAGAVVLACTDLRAVEAMAIIEKALGKPVITSNQAMMSVVCRLFGREGDMTKLL